MFEFEYTLEDMGGNIYKVSYLVGLENYSILHCVCVNFNGLVNSEDQNNDSSNCRINSLTSQVGLDVKTEE